MGGLDIHLNIIPQSGVFFSFSPSLFFHDIFLADTMAEGGLFSTWRALQRCCACSLYLAFRRRVRTAGFHLLLFAFPRATGYRLWGGALWISMLATPISLNQPQPKIPTHISFCFFFWGGNGGGQVVSRVHTLVVLSSWRFSPFWLERDRSMDRWAVEGKFCIFFFFGFLKRNWERICGRLSC